MNDAAIRLQSSLPDESTAMTVTLAENYRYLAGFTGTAAVLLVTGTDLFLVTDGRYADQAREQAKGWNVVLHQGSVAKALIDLSVSSGVRSLWFEADSTPFGFYETMRELGRESSITLEPKRDVVESLRRIKSAAELNLIKAAFEITNHAFEHIFTRIRAGMTERQVAWELEKFMREAGADKIKENHVIASGPRSALPHGRATDRALARGDLLTMDIGAVVGGYYSDMTRTIAVGTVDGRQREVYGWVLEAQAMALGRMAPGAVCEETDAEIRDFFSARGVADHFSHSLGHALGLQIHESPRLAAGDRTALQAGMVITVEPGLYFPGWGGVRIEDPVIITNEGHYNLAAVTKELLVV
ncbi:MAG: M24 family metallopeptidase [Bacilli bacterium]